MASAPDNVNEIEQAGAPDTTPSVVIDLETSDTDNEGDPLDGLADLPPSRRPSTLAGNASQTSHGHVDTAPATSLAGAMHDLEDNNSVTIHTTTETHTMTQDLDGKTETVTTNTDITMTGIADSEKTAHNEAAPAVDPASFLASLDPALRQALLREVTRSASLDVPDKSVPSTTVDSGQTETSNANTGNQTTGTTSDNEMQDVKLDKDFLDAMPEKIREELLAVEAAERHRREREQARVGNILMEGIEEDAQASPSATIEAQSKPVPPTEADGGPGNPDAQLYSPAPLRNMRYSLDNILGNPLKTADASASLNNAISPTSEVENTPAMKDVNDGAAAPPTTGTYMQTISPDPEMDHPPVRMDVDGVDSAGQAPKVHSPSPTPERDMPHVPGPSAPSTTNAPMQPVVNVDNDDEIVIVSTSGGPPYTVEEVLAAIPAEGIASKALLAKFAGDEEHKNKFLKPIIRELSTFDRTAGRWFINDKPKEKPKKRAKIPPGHNRVQSNQGEHSNKPIAPIDEPALAPPPAPVSAPKPATNGTAKKEATKPKARMMHPQRQARLSMLLHVVTSALGLLKMEFTNVTDEGWDRLFARMPEPSAREANSTVATFLLDELKVGDPPAPAVQPITGAAKPVPLVIDGPAAPTTTLRGTPQPTAFEHPTSLLKASLSKDVPQPTPFEAPNTDAAAPPKDGGVVNLVSDSEDEQFTDAPETAVPNGAGFDGAMATPVDSEPANTSLPAGSPGNGNMNGNGSGRVFDLTGSSPVFGVGTIEAPPSRNKAHSPTPSPSPPPTTARAPVTLQRSNVPSSFELTIPNIIRSEANFAPPSNIIPQPLLSQTRTRLTDCELLASYGSSSYPLTPAQIAGVQQAMTDQWGYAPPFQVLLDAKKEGMGTHFITPFATLPWQQWVKKVNDRIMAALEREEATHPGQVRGSYSGLRQAAEHAFHEREREKEAREKERGKRRRLEEEGRVGAEKVRRLD